MNESPIKLPLEGCWEVSAESVDSTECIKALEVLIPTAQIIFIEGDSVSPEPESLYKDYQDDGPYIPPTQIIWTTGNKKKFRCKWNNEFVEKLADLTERHAEPELCSSLFIYDGNQLLVEWPEAFYGPMWISKKVHEDSVKIFSSRLGLEYHLFADI